MILYEPLISSFLYGIFFLGNKHPFNMSSYSICISVYHHLNYNLALPSAILAQSCFPKGVYASSPGAIHKKSLS